MNRFSVIALIGTALWIGYDYMMQWVYRWLERRLAAVTAKYKPSKDAQGNTKQAPPAADSIFGEYGDEPETNGDEEDKA